MGTVADLAVLHRDRGYAHQALDAAVAELKWVEATMTRYDATSEVGRVNSAAGVRPVAVSGATAWVIREGLRWAERSQGAFDPALGRVAELWDATTRDEPPPPKEWARFAGAGMFREVEVSGEGRNAAVFLADPAVALDLGGIGKGYAVDRAADTLREWGISSALVNVGGDLYALGDSPDGDPWNVGVRNPDDPEGIITTLQVSDGAVATSGDYQRFFEHEGRRYHHLIDPSTGAPRLTAARSLTVAAGTCMVADAAATAAFGMTESGVASLLSRSGGNVRVVHRV
jgi:thiamine biosynthesis lipoprotein